MVQVTGTVTYISFPCNFIWEKKNDSPSGFWGVSPSALPSLTAHGGCPAPTGHSPRVLLGVTVSKHTHSPVLSVPCSEARLLPAGPTAETWEAAPSLPAPDLDSSEPDSFLSGRAARPRRRTAPAGAGGADALGPVCGPSAFCLLEG